MQNREDLFAQIRRFPECLERQVGDFLDQIGPPINVA